MTQARTVGEKRRRKRGRPRKEGVARYPGGKIKATKEAKDLHAPARIARCRAMGWTPKGENGAYSDEQLNRAGAQHMMSAHGRAYEAGLITRSMYEGLEGLLRVRSEYGRAILAPSPWPSCGRYDVDATGRAEPRDLDHARALERVTTAERSLAAAGSGAGAAVEDLLSGAFPIGRLALLRQGAIALARHFVEPDDWSA